MDAFHRLIAAVYRAITNALGALNNALEVEPDDDMVVAENEQLDYHLAVCEAVEHEADLRSFAHDTDFALWRTEYALRQVDYLNGTPLDGAR